MMRNRSELLLTVSALWPPDIGNYGIASNRLKNVPDTAYAYIGFARPEQFFIEE